MAQIIDFNTRQEVTISTLQREWVETVANESVDNLDIADIISLILKRNLIKRQLVLYSPILITIFHTITLQLIVTTMGYLMLKQSLKRTMCGWQNALLT